MVVKRLKEFDVDFNQHVIGCTTYRASVIVKFGRKTEPFHLRCVVHSIYLTICNVFKKRVKLWLKMPINKQTTLKNWFIEEDLDLSNTIFSF